MGNFTFEETNLLCIYNTGSRTGLIEALTEMCGELFAGGSRAAGADGQRPLQAPGYERRRVCRAGAVPGFRRVKTTPRPSGAA